MGEALNSRNGTVDNLEDDIGGLKAQVREVMSLSQTQVV